MAGGPDRSPRELIGQSAGGRPVRCADGRAGFGVAAAAGVAGTAAGLGAAPRVEGPAGVAACPARLGLLGARPRVGRAAARGAAATGAAATGGPSCGAVPAAAGPGDLVRPAGLTLAVQHQWPSVIRDLGLRMDVRLGHAAAYADYPDLRGAGLCLHARVGVQIGGSASVLRGTSLSLTVMLSIGVARCRSRIGPAVNDLLEVAAGRRPMCLSILPRGRQAATSCLPDAPYAAKADVHPKRGDAYTYSPPDCPPSRNRELLRSQRREELLIIACSPAVMPASRCLPRRCVPRAEQVDLRTDLPATGSAGFTDEPVDDATLARCLRAATWAPSGANAQEWRFVILRSPELRAVVARAAAQALKVIEPVYGFTRPADHDDSRRARTNRAMYERHDRTGEFTSVLFTQKRFPRGVRASARGFDLPGHAELPAGSPRPGMGACLTSWAWYGGEPPLREAAGVPGDWMLAGHIVVGWPRGNHGPIRRRPISEVTFLDRWGEQADHAVGHGPGPSMTARAQRAGDS